MISARATTPPIDRPLPMPLAKVSMSGVAPPWACACQPQKCSPVRPQPVCTSSVIHRMPCSSSTLRNAPSSPSGGAVKPPTPWIGSAIRRRRRRPLVEHVAQVVDAGLDELGVGQAANGLRKRSPPCT